jgi:hypothetical protein
MRHGKPDLTEGARKDGTAPDTIKRLVDHFDQNRKVCHERRRRVFLSSDYKEEQLPKAKTPHEQESLKRTIAAIDKAIDTLAYELYGLTAEEIGVVEVRWPESSDSQ